MHTELVACSIAAPSPAGSLTIWATKPMGISQTGPRLPSPSATYLGEFALPILSILGFAHLEVLVLEASPLGGL